MPSADGWRAFVRGAAAELLGAGVELLGRRARDQPATVPRGAGLSSSAALEVALVLALLAVGEARSPGRLDLARLCSRIENEWVGAQTGLLDQISSLFGEHDRALRIDFRSLDVSNRSRSSSTATGSSRSTRASTTRTPRSGYNERRAECARACARARRLEPAGRDARAGG